MRQLPRPLLLMQVAAHLAARLLRRRSTHLLSRLSVGSPTPAHTGRPYLRAGWELCVVGEGDGEEGAAAPGLAFDTFPLKFIGRMVVMAMVRRGILCQGLLLFGQNASVGALP